jgi:hypothetical protein
MLGVRALGVAGLFAALLGAVGARATPDFSLRQQAESVWSEPSQINILLFETPDRFLTVCFWLLTIGIAATAIALILLMIGGLIRLAGRRNVAGSNAALQTALCIALLVGVNWYSFENYRRYDWTGRRFTWQGISPRLVKSDRFESQFTLPPEVIADLQQLRGETSVIVYQRHKTFGQLTDKPDAYDYAAERKVVEKVKDLVQLFREFGPRFRVETLDVEDEGYTATLERLTKDNPRLAKAIDTAPENSIFFHTKRAAVSAEGKPEMRESVQRLSFNDFYQLDKTDSNKQKNLVLLPQGVASFARRVLAVEEKKPKVAIGSIHEYLTTEGIEEFSLAGLKKSLESNGFEVVDLVLKNWGDGEPVPAAHSLRESQLERLEEDLAESDAVLSINRQELAGMSAVLEKLKSKLTLDEVNRELRQLLRGQKMNEEARRRNIQTLEPQLDMLKEYISLQEKDRNEVLKQLDAIPDQERLAERRRMTDVKAKLTKLLADCDLLILPRLTLRNAIVGDRIPARLYRLDEAQASAVKEFMAAGKPVFAMFGPTNEPAERRMAAPPGPDSIEPLLAQLGIVFGSQTILFNVEAKAFSQRRSSLLATGADIDFPPVLFERPAVKRGLESSEPTPTWPNPISHGLKIVAGAAGSTDKLEKLKLRHPRPVYFLPVRGPATTAAEFLYADPESWNEPDPFPTRERTPRYEPTKPDSPTFGTRDAETRGPFPIGIAIETTVPAEWLGNTQPTAAADALLTASALTGETAPLQTVTQALLPTDQYAASKHPVPLRVAAVGHGGLFIGPELSPAKEQLLLLTCNWLLSRDERLPHDERKWQYPRVTMSDRRMRLWRDGALIILPASFAFLGAMVLLVRKYR